MNKVILAGRLVADPEIRYTQTGKAITNFRLAVNRRISKETSSNQPTADFFAITAWQKLGEICSNYLNKGSQVIVEGRLQTRSYDKDGEKRYFTEVIASDIEFVGGKKRNEQQDETQPGLNKQPQIGDGFGTDISDEEIPF